MLAATWTASGAVAGPESHFQGRQLLEVGEVIGQMMSLKWRVQLFETRTDCEVPQTPPVLKRYSIPETVRQIYRVASDDEPRKHGQGRDE